MEYFEILNLKREPFSNSPDPDFFFQSRQHVDCLQKLEIALRLRRGLNVVIGDVGTGKTTLCRQLIRKFSDNREVETYLVLDPHFSNPSHFLRHIAALLEDETNFEGLDDGDVKEKIKHQLFKKGIDEEKTIILIIDEGQKIPQPCLEVLRELLNYETNEYKLLQIVIFAQREFENVIEEYANFADRINLYHILEPLGFKDTLRMIRFRLTQSGEGDRSLSIFTFPALLAVYLSTGGYPRKIVNLCHKCLLTVIVQNRSKAGWFLVRSCVKRVFRSQSGKKKFYRWAAVAATALVMLFLGSEITSYKDVLMNRGGQKPPHRQLQALVTPEAGKNPVHNDAILVQETELPASEQENAAEETPHTYKEEDSRSTTLAREVKRDTDSAEGLPALQQHKPLAKEQANGTEHPQIPVVLGRVMVRKGESIWLMSRQVYGLFNNRILKRLISTNPQITDPNNVEAGTRIYFPAIRFAVKPPDADCWWIYLDEEDRLDAAFDKLRRYPKEAPQIRLVPNLSSTGDLKFTLVSREYFFDREKAEQMLESIPEEFVRMAKVFSGWEEEETVFFADPFLS